MNEAGGHIKKAGILQVGVLTEASTCSPPAIVGESTHEDRRRYGEPETTGLSQLSDIVTLESTPKHVIHPDARDCHSELEQVSRTPDLVPHIHLKSPPVTSGSPVTFFATRDVGAGLSVGISSCAARLDRYCNAACHGARSACSTARVVLQICQRVLDL